MGLRRVRMTVGMKLVQMVVMAGGGIIRTVKPVHMRVEGLR